jgi:hypothetical protein
MTGDCHVRICGGPGVRLPRATRPPRRTGRTTTSPATRPAPRRRHPGPRRRRRPQRHPRNARPLRDHHHRRHLHQHPPNTPTTSPKRSQPSSPATQLSAHNPGPPPRCGHLRLLHATTCREGLNWLELRPQGPRRRGQPVHPTEGQQVHQSILSNASLTPRTPPGRSVLPGARSYPPTGIVETPALIAQGIEHWFPKILT